MRSQMCSEAQALQQEVLHREGHICGDKLQGVPRRGQRRQRALCAQRLPGKMRQKIDILEIDANPPKLLEGHEKTAQDEGRLQVTEG